MKRRTGVAEQGGPLDRVLTQAFALETGEVRALIDRGAAYVDGRRCADATRHVNAGQKLTLVLEERGGESPGTPPPLCVLFEDGAILAVDKPAGLPAQPTPSRQGFDLLALATAHLGRAAGLVHRLDKDTTGVTVFGKTKGSTSALAAAFREGRAKKTYLAVCAATLPERGEIDLPLSRDPSRPGRWRASKKANGIEALTRFERRAVGEGFAIVDLFPQTGRTHQLRAHLAGIGAPILGDALYAGPQTPPRAGESPPARCLLHALRLEIDGRVFESPVPADIARYLDAC
jgi:23S rRNA pseudouridine1911/1915/1917 synthase